jgi:hypothetical protein
LSAAARRYFVRALAALRTGDSEGSGGDFRAALDLAPQFVEARLGLAAALGGRDSERVIRVLRTGLGLAPTVSERRRLLLCLGDTQLAAADYHGAEATYHEALQAGAVVGPRLARLRARTGRFAAAVELLLTPSRPPG